MSTIRGRKPGCVAEAGDTGLELACLLDDDMEGDAHYRRDFDRFAADGTIDAREADHLSRHATEDAERTRKAFALSVQVNRANTHVEALVDELRAR